MRAGAWAALLAAGSFVGITAVASPAAAGPVGTVTPYDFDLTFAPTKMATGADGNVYFTTGLTTVAAHHTAGRGHRVRHAGRRLVHRHRCRSGRERLVHVL